MKNDIYEELFFNALNPFIMLREYIEESKRGVPYCFKERIIPKGTVLYRIRKYSENIDFSNPSEWTPNPKKSRNRCNNEGETALYLGNTELVCLLETQIGFNEKYALGEYLTTEDIEVKAFTNVHPNEGTWKFLVCLILNAFLISPANNKNNENLFKVINEYLNDDCLKNLFKTIKHPSFPLKLGYIFQNEDYYEITNSLCDTLKNKNTKGICYSSCFIPFETVGIECSNYNVCLYENSLKSLEFIKAEVKTNTKKFTGINAIEMILKGEKNNEN